jgi:hypothetical protein
MNQPMSPLARLAALVLTAGLMLLALPARSQTSPIHKFVLPVYIWAMVSSGEQVLFQGQATLETQLVKDPVTPVHELLVNVSWSGLTGTAYPSLTRYVLNGRESVMLPHASLQSMEISFPMVPQPGSPIMATRSGIANFSFFVNTTTGAVIALASGSMSVK